MGGPTGLVRTFLVDLKARKSYRLAGSEEYVVQSTAEGLWRFHDERCLKKSTWSIVVMIYRHIEISNKGLSTDTKTLSDQLQF